MDLYRAIRLPNLQSQTSERDPELHHPAVFIGHDPSIHPNDERQREGRRLDVGPQEDPPGGRCASCHFCTAIANYPPQDRNCDRPGCIDPSFREREQRFGMGNFGQQMHFSDGRI